MTAPITLCKGPLTVELQSALGGRITSFRWKEEDLFLPLDGAAMDLQTTPPGGCYPLVPWSNRIRDARLHREDGSIQLMPSLGEQGHALHGHGLRHAWTHTQSDHSCTMQYAHAAGRDGWPWAYVVEQTVHLTESSMELTMHLENRSNRPMPFGLGWHPYFPCNAQTLVQFAAGQTWPSADGQVFPNGPEPTPAKLDRQVEGPMPMKLDQGFSHWDGRFRIAWPDRGLVLDAVASSELNQLHVYTPPGKGFCCLEPVSHAVDGFNLAALGVDAAGFRVLAPGDAEAVTWSLYPQ